MLPLATSYFGLVTLYVLLVRSGHQSSKSDWWFPPPDWCSSLESLESIIGSKFYAHDIRKIDVYNTYPLVI